MQGFLYPLFQIKSAPSGSPVELPVFNSCLLSGQKLCVQCWGGEWNRVCFSQSDFIALRGSSEERESPFFFLSYSNWHGTSVYEQMLGLEG